MKDKTLSYPFFNHFTDHMPNQNLYLHIFSHFKNFQIFPLFKNINCCDLPSKTTKLLCF